MVYLDYYQYICSVTNWMSLLASLKGVTSIIWFSPLPVFCRYVLSWPKLFILLAELLALYLLHYPNARSSAQYCKAGKVEIRRGKIPQWLGFFFLHNQLKCHNLQYNTLVCLADCKEFCKILWKKNTWNIRR